MNDIKNVASAPALLVLAIGLLQGCKGEQGAQGPAGPAGSGGSENVNTLSLVLDTAECGGEGEFSQTITYSCSSGIAASTSVTCETLAICNDGNIVSEINSSTCGEGEAFISTSPFCNGPGAAVGYVTTCSVESAPGALFSTLGSELC